MIRVIYPDGKSEEVKRLTFSGGEEHVNIPPRTSIGSGVIEILARIKSSADLMATLLVSDALRRTYPNRRRLYLRYLPYARQDRVCVPGDAFSLEVLSGILNAQEITEIVTLDVHSHTALGLIKNLYSTTSETFAKGILDLIPTVSHIVAPDKGALRRAKDWLYRWNHIGGNATLAIASKQRNELGEITQTVLDTPITAGADCLIVDDICDGGRTFIELAKVLKTAGAGKIYLYVSHGIFSKGTQCLIDAGIEKIFTTDSFYDPDDAYGEKDKPNVTVIARFFNGASL